MPSFPCLGQCGKTIAVVTGEPLEAEAPAGQESYRGAYRVCPKCFGHVCSDCGTVCPACGVLLVDVEHKEEASYLSSQQQEAYQVLLTCRGAILESHRSLLGFDEGQRQFLGEKVEPLMTDLRDNLIASGLLADGRVPPGEQLLPLLLEQVHMAYGVPRLLKMIDSDFQEPIAPADVFYFYGVEEALDYAHHMVNPEIRGGLLVEVLENDAVLDQGLFICEILTSRRLGFDLIDAPNDVQAILNMITRIGLRLGLAEVLARAEGFLLAAQFERLDRYLAAYFLRLAFIMTKIDSREEVQSRFRTILSVMAKHPDPALSRAAGELAAK